MPRLGLALLHKRRRDQPFSFWMLILAKEEHHSLLPESYKKNNKPTYDDDYDDEIKFIDMWDSYYLRN